MRARLPASVLLAATAVFALAAADDLPRTGAISGKIENPARCKGVAALDRSLKDPRKLKVYPAQIDKKTGAFTVSGLPPGRYDLRVRVEGGRIDGADLALEKSQHSDDPLTEKDRRKIRDFIENYPDRFCDVLRPLAISGNGKFAKVLVEKVRYRPFHSASKDSRVWRVEIWPFRNAYGKWIKERHGWTVLARVRAPGDMPIKEFHKLVRLFEPELGGIVVDAGKVTDGVEYKIPKKWARGKGLTPGALVKNPLTEDEGSEESQ